MISENILNTVKDRLVAQFHPDKIILFGSQARGLADERSDVDILVVCSFEGKRRRLMVEMDRALGELDYAFDILVLTPEEFQRDRNIAGTIGRYAWQQGRAIYEQS